MRSLTLAEEHKQAAEIALDHFRESFLLAFRTMTDGLPKLYAQKARLVIKFFETETNAAIWERLKFIIDPTTGMSLAEGWLAQWELLASAVGKPEGE